MSYSVTMPDGTTIDGVPEGTTQSQLMSRYSRYQPTPQVQPGSARDTPTMAAVRGIGLGAQAGLEGLGSIYDLARLPFNAMGAKIPSMTEQIRSVSPFKPENEGENIASDLIRGTMQAGTAMATGAGLASSARPVVAKIGQVLSTGPGTQLTTGATSEASRGLVERTGGSPLWQTVGAVAGGITPSVLATGADIGWRGLKSAVQPLFQSGREQIVGNAINQAASNPNAAMANLANPKEIVPGSLPTTAEAAQDYGIMGLQKAVKSQASPPFAERASQQNSARNLLLDSVAQHDAALASAKAERDAVTTPMRENSLSLNQTVDAPLGYTDVRSVNNAIDGILSSPKGSREMVQKAMEWVKGRLNGITDPASLYEVRKDINDAMQGKFSGEASNLRLAKGELKTVKDALDETIESGAQGYKDYLSKYREMSIPINQMETAQDIKSRVMLSAPDTNGYDFISQPKWSNVVQANREELAKTLDPKQMQIMDSITADLDRGATLNNAAVRPAGSDTFQNLSLANMLGSFLGKSGMNPFTATVTRPLSFLYKIPDKAMNQLMIDAMLDPRLARQMMQKASATTVKSFGEALRQRAIATGLGTFMTGDAAMQRRPLEVTIRPSDRLRGQQ